MNIKLINNKKRTKYYIARSQQLLNQVITSMPDKNQNFKLISPVGGFSSINLILYVLEREIINNLYVSSLRVGKKEALYLMAKGKAGLIKNAFFCVGQIMKANIGTNKKYLYWQHFLNMAKEMKWTIKSIKNHSKIILMETDENNYVIETSSNLNENPSLEFFNIENDRKSFEFYKTFFEEILE